MAIIKDPAARAIKPGHKPIAHGGVSGLRLMPTNTKGKGRWELRYTSPVTGKRRDAGLGAYPNVGIAAAKQKAEIYHQQIAEGVDPLDTKRQKQQTQHILTFENAALRRHADSLPTWGEAHARKWLNSLKKHIFPVIGSMPLDAITPAHIAEALRPIWIDRHPTAKKISQRISEIMDWAWGLGIIKANPVPAVMRVMPKHSHKPIRHPSMPWREIPSFIAQCMDGGTSYDVKKLALEFIILTGGRSGEIRGARWEEIDFESATWTIPPARMKADDWHQVPLSDRALALLLRLKGRDPEVIFPSTKAGRLLVGSTLGGFMTKANRPSDIPSRYAVVHGFRASFRNWCSESGFRRDLSERALAHSVQNQVEAAYHRTNLLDERRPMMQQWADFVTGQHNNVVPLREAR
jgi:integrase